MKSKFHVIGILVMLTVLILSVLPCKAGISGVGMVLTLQGEASISNDRSDIPAKMKVRKAEPMAMLLPGDIITAGKDCKMKVVLLSTGREIDINLTSAGKIQVGTDSLTDLTTKKVFTGEKTQSAVNLPQSAPIDSRRIMGGRVRGVGGSRILYPLNNSAIIPGDYPIIWVISHQDATSADEKFILKIQETNQGTDIYRNEVSGESFSLTQDIINSLEPGKSYSVTLLPPLTPPEDDSDVLVIKARSFFTVLSPEKTWQIKEAQKNFREELANAGDHSVAYMKMMLIYQDCEMFYEAINMGLELKKILPNNLNLLCNLHYLYRTVGDTENTFAIRREAEQIQPGIAENI